VAGESTAIVFDSARAFREAAELHRSIVHVPEPVGDGLEADGLLGEDVADINIGPRPRR
jgi:hypothetical protein